MKPTLSHAWSGNSSNGAPCRPPAPPETHSQAVSPRVLACRAVSSRRPPQVHTHPIAASIVDQHMQLVFLLTPQVLHHRLTALRFCCPHTAAAADDGTVVLAVHVPHTHLTDNQLTNVSSHKVAAARPSCSQSTSFSLTHCCLARCNVHACTSLDKTLCDLLCVRNQSTNQPVQEVKWLLLAKYRPPSLPSLP